MSKFRLWKLMKITTKVFYSLKSVRSSFTFNRPLLPISSMLVTDVGDEVTVLTLLVTIKGSIWPLLSESTIFYILRHQHSNDVSNQGPNWNGPGPKKSINPEPGRIRLKKPRTNSDQDQIFWKNLGSTRTNSFLRILDRTRTNKFLKISDQLGPIGPRTWRSVDPCVTNHVTGCLWNDYSQMILDDTVAKFHFETAVCFLSRK